MCCAPGQAECVCWSSDTVAFHLLEGRSQPLSAVGFRQAASLVWWFRGDQASRYLKQWTPLWSLRERVTEKSLSPFPSTGFRPASLHPVTCLMCLAFTAHCGEDEAPHSDEGIPSRSQVHGHGDVQCSNSISRIRTEGCALPWAHAVAALVAWGTVSPALALTASEEQIHKWLLRVVIDSSSGAVAPALQQGHRAHCCP